MNQDPRNSTFAPVSAFQKQMVLNTVQRDPEAERRARYLRRQTRPRTHPDDLRLMTRDQQPTCRCEMCECDPAEETTITQKEAE